MFPSGDMYILFKLGRQLFVGINLVSSCRMLFDLLEKNIIFLCKSLEITNKGISFLFSNPCMCIFSYIDKKDFVKLL